MDDDALFGLLVAQERAALDCWARGDTLGYAATMADEATYFDHATRGRLQGLGAIKEHVAAFQGKMSIPRHEIVNPAMHRAGDLAVLAFNWDPFDATGRLIMRWNATSVYRNLNGQWRMIHAHWAMAASG